MPSGSIYGNNQNNIHTDKGKATAKDVLNVDYIDDMNVWIDNSSMARVWTDARLLIRILDNVCYSCESISVFGNYSNIILEVELKSWKSGNDRPLHSEKGPKRWSFRGFPEKRWCFCQWWYPMIVCQTLLTGKSEFKRKVYYETGVDIILDNDLLICWWKPQWDCSEIWVDKGK